MIMRSLFRCSTRAAAAVAFASAAHLAAAQSPAVAPLASGDADAGKTLHDKDCIACHAQRFGDPSKMYTRPDHRVKTPAQLRTQVAVCNTQLGTHYFPDDEDNVAAYLNREYYHFKP